MADYSKYINSTGIHYISNSGSDENGRYSGGAAGDQTGNEWRLRSWYNRPWNCVLRHPDEKVRMKLAELACAAALNNLIGYDQNQRETYWAHLKASNYDPAQITIPCEADCSSGICANVRAVGYLLNMSALKNHTGTYTGNMRAALKKAGFEVLTASKYLTGSDYLLPGDILLNDQHHTATNITKGAKATSSTTPAVPETPSAEVPSRTVAWYGVVNTAELNVRTWAGTENANLKSYPTIKQGTKVGVCDTVKDKDGDPWYYVVIDGEQGEKYGFVSAAYITKQTASTPNTPNNDSAELSKTPQWVGKVTASILNVRSWAGTNNPVIKSWPKLAKGNLVDVCDTVTAVDGSRWYYVRINGKVYGFVHSAYIVKA